MTLYKTKFPQERSYEDGALTVTSEEESKSSITPLRNLTSAVTLTIIYILASPIKKRLLVDSD